MQIKKFFTEQQTLRGENANIYQTNIMQLSSAEKNSSNEKMRARKVKKFRKN